MFFDAESGIQNLVRSRGIGDVYKCDGLPCVWLNNKENMTLFVMTQREDETEPKHYRHAMYRQMALIINDGPSGRGNRLKLPFCVVAGIREMFPDPGKVYTGHKDAGE